MSLKLNKVVLVPDGIHVRRVTVVDGVTLLLLGKTPTIVNTTLSVVHEMPHRNTTRSAELT